MKISKANCSKVSFAVFVSVLQCLVLVGHFINGEDYRWLIFCIYHIYLSNLLNYVQFSAVWKDSNRTSNLPAGIVSFLRIVLVCAVPSHSIPHWSLSAEQALKENGWRNKLFKKKKILSSLPEQNSVFFLTYLKADTISVIAVLPVSNCSCKII